MMHHLSISVIRADALFVSALQRGDHPSAEKLRAAVAAAQMNPSGKEAPLASVAARMAGWALARETGKPPAATIAASPAVWERKVRRLVPDTWEFFVWVIGS